MKVSVKIISFSLAACCALAGPLTEDSVRTLLQVRDEGMAKGDVDAVVGVHTTNAAISATFFGMSEATQEADVKEFMKEMECIGFKTRPQKIELKSGGAVVRSEIDFSHQPEKKRDRLITWRVNETLKIVLEDNLPKIASSRLDFLDQTLGSDELSERIMKLVRQDGGIDPETAIKLLEESGGRYRKGDGKRKKTTVSSGFTMQCGDEMAALATFIPGVQSLELIGTIVTDKSFADIGKIQTLETLYIMGPKISDAGIGLLADLPRLEYISLTAVGISDASLECFGDFPALKKLSISTANGLTDAGLRHLAGAETLESLTLGINMTDAGMAHLAHVPNLEYLQIKDAPVTDAGLVHVEKMEKLKSISLNQTEVTHQGAAKLKEKRPKLRITPTSLVEPCRGYRQDIEYAKRRWAKAGQKKEGATPTPEDLDRYLKRYGGFAAMFCEDGGTLTINPIGTGAECSIHGKTKVHKSAEPLKGLSKEDFDADGASVGRWTMDLEAAEKLAAEKQLPILINFTGSDWCYWCKLMEKNVFTLPEWKTYAHKNIVMVLIDFPRNKTAVPEKYKERNDALKAQYGIRGYPTFVLLKPDGKTELGRLKAGRDKTPGSFIEEVKALLNAEGE